MTRTKDDGTIEQCLELFDTDTSRWIWKPPMMPSKWQAPYYYSEDDDKFSDFNLNYDHWLIPQPMRKARRTGDGPNDFEVGPPILRCGKKSRREDPDRCLTTLVEFEHWRRYNHVDIKLNPPSWHSKPTARGNTLNCFLSSKLVRSIQQASTSGLTTGPSSNLERYVKKSMNPITSQLRDKFMHWNFPSHRRRLG